MNVKRFAVFAAVLALGMVLGALLFGPANIALGQAEYPLFALAFPPNPCVSEVQSTISVAEDGSATARLIAHPPSPCTLLHTWFDFDVLSTPADAATCREFSPPEGEGATVMYCEFSPDHRATTFTVNLTGRPEAPE